MCFWKFFACFLCFFFFFVCLLCFVSLLVFFKWWYKNDKPGTNTLNLMVIDSYKMQVIEFKVHRKSLLCVPVIFSHEVKSQFTCEPWSGQAAQVTVCFAHGWLFTYRTVTVRLACVIQLWEEGRGKGKHKQSFLCCTKVLLNCKMF